jgi:hypothetical protein
VTAQPSAYVYDDAVQLVYSGTDGHAYYIEYGAEGWSDWADLGDNYAYDPYQYAWDDTLHLTYTGGNGEIYYKVYAGGEGEKEADSGY